MRPGQRASRLLVRASPSPDFPIKKRAKGTQSNASQLDMPTMKDQKKPFQDACSADDRILEGIQLGNTSEHQRRRSVNTALSIEMKATRMSAFIIPTNTEKSGSFF